MEKETIQISAHQLDIVNHEEVLYRCPEDGELRYGIRYYLRATLEDGTRFLHFKGFDDEADKRLSELEAAVAKRGVINLEYWAGTYPAYGSKAWEREDEEREYQFRSALAAGDHERADLFC